MYTVFKAKDFFQLQRSPGFLVESTGSVPNADISLTYIRLDNSRDPVENDRVISINSGFTGIYILLHGTITFTFYIKEEKKKIYLKKKEYIRITFGSLFDIEGSGEILLLCLPSWSEKMYSFLPKP